MSIFIYALYGSNISCKNMLYNRLKEEKFINEIELLIDGLTKRIWTCKPKQKAFKAEPQLYKLIFFKK